MPWHAIGQSGRVITVGREYSVQFARFDQVGPVSSRIAEILPERIARISVDLLRPVAVMAYASV